MSSDVHGLSADSGSNSFNDSGDVARQQAIDQIGRRRRFQRTAVISVLGMVLLVVVWAVSEYNNADGWPTNRFSQSSSIYHVWNMWIIYPLVAWGCIWLGEACPCTRAERFRRMRSSVRWIVSLASRSSTGSGIGELQPDLARF
jgi:hypothetical protein